MNKAEILEGFNHVIAFLSQQPEEYLRGKASELFAKSYDGYDSASQATVLRQAAKTAEKKGSWSAIERLLEGDGVTIKDACMTVGFGQRKYGGEAFIGRYDATRGAELFLDNDFLNCYYLLVEERTEQEIQQAQIDLARERIAQLQEEFPTVDLAKESLAVFSSQYADKKQAGEVLELSDNRVKQLASSGRIGTLVLGRYIFTDTELRGFAQTERPTGIHRKKSKEG